MPRVGDRYVIEIGDIMRSSSGSKPLYKIKGFNSLVFDAEGINRLTEYKEHEAAHETNIIECAWLKDVLVYLTKQMRLPGISNDERRVYAEIFAQLFDRGDVVIKEPN